uniref:Uncharacterized protein n=1 Tax=Anguilla anguilla TaxID=7936 RepID=A0A0E9UA94_ANGAN
MSTVGTVKEEQGTRVRPPPPVSTQPKQDYCLHCGFTTTGKKC